MKGESNQEQEGETKVVLKGGLVAYDERWSTTPEPSTGDGTVVWINEGNNSKRKYSECQTIENSLRPVKAISWKSKQWLI